MFSGIISTLAQVLIHTNKKSGAHFVFHAPTLDFSKVHVGDSIAVNGVCLTVTTVENKNFHTDVSSETMRISTFKYLNKNDYVNLELALSLTQGIHGHLVSGHVDDSIKIVAIKKNGEHITLAFALKQSIKPYIVRKGSVCINGISLTINAVETDIFMINAIPHTLSKTNLAKLKVGDMVNIEVDMIARYIEKLLTQKIIK